MAVRSKERNRISIATQCCSYMESCNNNIHAASDGAQDKKVGV